MESFGDFMKELRREKKLTLNEVHLGSGVSVSHLSSIERGVRMPPDDETIKRILKALGAPNMFTHAKRLALQQQLEVQLQETLKNFPKKQQSAMIQLARMSSDHDIWATVLEALNVRERLAKSESAITD
jgi:transcriptional regulator with XRE-family HTH domain